MIRVAPDLDRVLPFAALLCLLLVLIQQRIHKGLALLRDHAGGGIALGDERASVADDLLARGELQPAERDDLLPAAWPAHALAVLRHLEEVG